MLKTTLKSMRPIAVLALALLSLAPLGAGAQEATPEAAPPAATSSETAFALALDPDLIGPDWVWRTANNGPIDLIALKGEAESGYAGHVHTSYAGPIGERATIEVLVSNDDIESIVDMFASVFRRYEAIADPWFEAGDEGWGDYDASGSHCSTLRLAYVPQLDIDDTGAAFAVCILDEKTAVIVTVSGTPEPGDERDRAIDIVNLIWHRSGN